MGLVFGVPGGDDVSEMTLPVSAFGFAFVLWPLGAAGLLVSEAGRRQQFLREHRLALQQLRLTRATEATAAELAAVAAALAGAGGAGECSGERAAEEAAVLSQWTVAWAALSPEQPLGAGGFAEVWSATLHGEVIIT